MQDFHRLVKEALEEDRVKNFLKDWNADKNIKLSLSPAYVHIKKNAFFKDTSGVNSLQHIYQRSKQTNDEIAFTAIFDPDFLTIHEIIKGRTGDSNACDWNKGNLLKESYKQADIVRYKVMLCHTHPKKKWTNGKPKPYGAICSKIKWTKKDLKAVHDDGIAKKMLDTGIYKTYGGDYCEMYMRAKEEEKVCDHFLIISPRCNQLGIFKIKSKGRVVYHPWILID